MVNGVEMGTQSHRLGVDVPRPRIGGRWAMGRGCRQHQRGHRCYQNDGKTFHGASRVIGLKQRAECHAASLPNIGEGTGARQ